MYKSFENLDVWREGMHLVLDIYKELSTCKDFAFLDQIKRSAISIPSNIAEGYERQSDKEFIRYLYIARGSCGELRTQIYLAMSLNYLDRATGDNLIDRAAKISSMIYNLIKFKENS